MLNKFRSSMRRLLGALLCIGSNSSEFEELGTGGAGPNLVGQISRSYQPTDTAHRNAEPCKRSRKQGQCQICVACATANVIHAAPARERRLFVAVAVVLASTNTSRQGRSFHVAGGGSLKQRRAWVVRRFCFAVGQLPCPFQSMQREKSNPAT